MKVVVLENARQDLLDGYEFYENQAPGVGAYFLRTVTPEIDSLRETAGIHRRVKGRFHWVLVRKFSHAIYYYVEGDIAYVDAVIDCRRSPEWIRRRLRQ
jgi:plasmid stabilization system protein ParE